MKKVLFFSMLACAFVACGGGNVDKVKNATLRGYDTMTIGAAIEGSKICESIKYEDISKDGLNAVKIICAEESKRIKAKYDEELKKHNENLAGILGAFKKLYLGADLSDDEIIEASKKFVKQDGEKKSLDEKGFKEFLSQKGLERKQCSFISFDYECINYSSYNPLIALSKQFDNEPKLPKSVIREATFIIKPDNTVEPKKDDFFVVVDGKKEKGDYRILSEFYKR